MSNQRHCITLNVKVDNTRLYCAVVAYRSSEMGQGSGTGVEWNHQFSLLVDDANVEMLEVLIRDGHNPQGFQKPIARCKIPLLR